MQTNRQDHIVIENNIIFYASKMFRIDHGVFVEWFPKPLIGSHYLGDECFCLPRVHRGHRITIIHKNPSLLGPGSNDAK
jgi:hypothetical protein